MLHAPASVLVLLLAGAPERHEVLLEDEAAVARANLELRGPGWSFRDHALHLEQGAGLTLGAAQWFPAAGNPEGWAVEARFGPVDEVPPGACPTADVSIAVYDGYHRSLLQAQRGLALLSSSRGDVRVPLEPADAAHLFRLERRAGEQLRLLVDGELRAEVELERGPFPNRAAFPAGVGPVAFGPTHCQATRSDWTSLAWELSPRPLPRGVDPKLWHAGAEGARVAAAIASRLPEPAASRVKALALGPAAAACAALRAVNDAVRIGAVRALRAEMRPQPPSSSKLAPSLPPPPGGRINSGDCGPGPMPPDQVAARARFMLAGLKDLPSMSSPRARAQAAEAFGSASEAERQEVERLEELRRPPHPICDPAGPCDCRPHRPAPFPMPSEVGQAARAVELMERWPLHPQNIYHSLEAASQAMSAPADAALLATELQAIAAGKGGCK